MCVSAMKLPTEFLKPAFGKLNEKAWERKGLSLELKLKVYKVVVLPSLLYSCETWTVYSHHAKVLNRYHLNRLRRIMKITWRDKIPDTDVLQLAEMTSLHTMISKIQLWWSAHVVRMYDNRQVSLKNFGIDPDKWETVATEKGTLGRTIRNGAIRFESGRLEKAWEKRVNRLNMKNSTARPTNSDLCATYVINNSGLE